MYLSGLVNTVANFCVRWYTLFSNEETRHYTQACNTRLHRVRENRTSLTYLVMRTIAYTFNHALSYAHSLSDIGACKSLVKQRYSATVKSRNFPACYSLHLLFASLLCLATVRRHLHAVAVHWHVVLLLLLARRRQFSVLHQLHALWRRQALVRRARERCHEDGGLFPRAPSRGV